MPSGQNPAVALFHAGIEVHSGHRANRETRIQSTLAEESDRLFVVEVRRQRTNGCVHGTHQSRRPNVRPQILHQTRLGNAPTSALTTGVVERRARYRSLAFQRAPFSFVGVPADTFAGGSTVPRSPHDSVSERSLHCHRLGEAVAGSPIGHCLAPRLTGGPLVEILYFDGCANHGRCS